MTIPTVILVLAVLLAVVSLAEPLAQRLGLPSSVILALIGLVIGTASAAVGQADGAVGEWAEAIEALPINSQVFLLIFLPALLFHGALSIEAREISGDIVPILAMAIIAVLLATATIGGALWQLGGAPFVACLLVGAIVATTDPSAVIAIFRDLGAPGRLNRLVEGESLLNDAVAITLFVIFLGLLTASEELSIGGAALRVFVVPLAGAAGGFLAAHIVAALFAFSGGNRLVQVSLTLSLPYLVFVLAEHWHVSGPIAVAAAGLTLSGLGPSRVSPANWRYLREVWDQLAFWAGSLVFILAAILVPKLMVGFSWRDALLLVVLIVAALASRAAMLFGLLPILARLRLSPAISGAYKTVMLWGGLRGAVTLALALAVTESAALPEEIKRFVAVLATGFVLFTLVVQGTTLKPLMRYLGLDRLNAVDASLREQALHWAHADVRKGIAATAQTYALPSVVAAQVTAEFSREDDEREIAGEAAGIGEADRVALGLAALAAREADLIVQHLDQGTASPGMVGQLLARARRLLDAARASGAAGYAEESARALAFSRRDRWANWLHFRLGIGRFLERQLAGRFEMLVVNRIVVNELFGFADGQLAALLGDPVRGAAKAALEGRLEGTMRSLDALALQYPAYSEELQRRFLRMSALRRERGGYERLHAEGLIGPEVHRALLDDVDRRTRDDRRPRLDLQLNTRALIGGVPMFAAFEEAHLQELCRLARPAFAMPGQRLIARGERGDAAFFIASGAVEVETGRDRVRLGRGDVFGEMALLSGRRRQADVTAIAYSHLLVLYARDFLVFLDSHPEMRVAIEAIAAERLSTNRGETPEAVRQRASA